MPRGQYDRTKTKEQRAAEKKTVAGKGTKKSAPAVTPPAITKGLMPSEVLEAADQIRKDLKQKAPSPTKTEWKDTPLNVEQFYKETGSSGYDLRQEMDRVSALLTNLSTNRLTLGDCGNVELLSAMEREIGDAVEHLARLRRMLPHGISQPTAKAEVQTASKVDLQAAEKERIAAEVARRVGPAPTQAVPPPSPVPLPGTGPVGPPAFLPLAAPRA